MTIDLRKSLWLGAVVVMAAILAFAGPSLIAGTDSTAVASAGCAMDQGSSGGGCCMMGGSAAASHVTCQGCAMLSGVVTAVDARKGSVTIQVSPAPNGGDAARKLISQTKVGDALPLMVMLGKDGRPAAASAGAAVRAAKYACPMHPDVTSDKPGKCSKCGMNLHPVEAGHK